MGKVKRVEVAPEGSWVLEDDDQDDTWSSGSEAAHLDSSRSSTKVPIKRHVGRSSNSSLHFKTPVEGLKARDMQRSLRSNQRAEPAFVMPSMNTRTATSSHKTNTNSSARQRNALLPDEAAPRSDRRTAVIEASRAHALSSSTSQDPLWLPLLIWSHLVLPVLQFASSVFSLLYRIFKPLLVLVVAIWVMGFFARMLLMKTVSRALAPLCLLPGSAHLSSFCAISQSASPVEFDELMTVQSAFEDVLASSASGASLPLDMKRGEASIRDLKHVVQYSALPSRNELVFEFTGFIDTARQASSDLTKFNSRIGRAVDRVIGINRWTLQVIDGIAGKEASRGAINRLLGSMVLAPFNAGQGPTELVTEQYLEHARAVEEQIAELIIEAQALLAILQNLDDRLDVIQSISTRDGLSLKGNRDELFEQLWTWVGGNRASLRKNNEQKQLLNQVNAYRQSAWEHVSGTILKLQAIASGLEDLRERVGAPDVLGIRPESLKMHIEHIQMGVERLEEQRSENRKVEGARHRTIMDRGNAVEGGRVIEALRMVDAKAS